MNKNKDTNAYQRDRCYKIKAAGNCIRCLNPRGENGTSSHCRPCAEKMNDYSSKLRGRQRMETVASIQASIASLQSELETLQAKLKAKVIEEITETEQRLNDLRLIA